MLFIVRRFPCKLSRHSRSFNDLASINWVRDRALDHAVEKERDLRTMLNLTNLIISEPAKSLPLSLIAQNRDSLQIPIRPIDFIRKYSSIFLEFLPGGIGIHPHVKLTPEIIGLHSEEQMIYQTEIHMQEAADRLLKLLMVARMNRIPLHVVDRLKWDLGLPQNFTQSLVPQFPDYFQVKTSGNGNEPCLELVCWSDELAVSVLEKKAMKDERLYRKGMPISFPLKYSREFEMDDKFKKWVDEWQKLPYVSPYENALHLQPKSDESDKWAVALLHEVLSLLVPKKTEKDNLLALGEFLGLRSRFKRALLQHPGIFYISSKLGTHTVVLRDGYKRDLLIGKPHPLMGMRSKYMYLMCKVNEEKKSNGGQVDGARNKKVSEKSKEEHKIELKGSESEEDDSEFEGSSYDDDYSDEEEEGNSIPMNRGRPGRMVKTSTRHLQSKSVGRSRTNSSDDEDYDNVTYQEKRNPRRAEFDEKMIRRNTRNSSIRRNSWNSREGVENENVVIIDRKDRRKERSDEKMRRRNMHNSSDRRNPRYSRESEYDDMEKKNERSMGKRRTTSKAEFDKKVPPKANQWSDRWRGTREANPTRYSGRKTERSNVPRTREGQL